LAYKWVNSFPSASGTIIYSNTYWNELTTAARYITDNHATGCGANRSNNTANRGNNGNRTCSDCAHHSSNNANNGSVTSCGNASANGNYSNNGNCSDLGVYRSSFRCRSVRCGGDGRLMRLRWESRNV